MNRICRIGDRVEGQCEASGSDHPRHFTGVWETGSNSSMADGLGIVRVNDTGTTDCGHVFKAITGALSATADGRNIHRVGDAVQVIDGGNGVSITGSGSAQSN